MAGCRTGSGRNTPPPAEIGPVRIAQLPTLLFEQVYSRVRASAIANSASSAQSHRRQVRGWVSVLGHEGRFVPPRVSSRSAFREETFAGRCGKRGKMRRNCGSPSSSCDMVCCLLFGGCEQAARLIGSGYRMTVAAPPIEPSEQTPWCEIPAARVCQRPSSRRYSRSHRNKRHKPCRGRGAPSFPSSFHDVGS